MSQEKTPTHPDKDGLSIKVGDHVTLHGVVTAMHSGGLLEVHLDGELAPTMLRSSNLSNTEAQRT